MQARAAGGQSSSVTLPGSEEPSSGYALILASTITQNRPIAAAH